MNRLIGLSVLISVLLLVVLGTACGNGEAAATPNDSAPVEEPAGNANLGASPGLEPSASEPAQAPAVQPAPAVGAPAPPFDTKSVPAVVSPPVATSIEPSYAPANSSMSSQLLQVGSAQTGIWVTGLGSITLEPDLAIVQIGVETSAVSVAAARDQAARAMAEIVQAVKNYGLTSEDIQTSSFNIYPQYEYTEVVERGISVHKQVLVGYRVSNTANIKIGSIAGVGPIIDDVAQAGGNATRINGISFTVEDTKPFMAQLREEAVTDALTKAQHFATLTGVSVGPLTYISEIGGGTIVPQPVPAPRMGFAEAAAAPLTSISGGELELSLSVQAIFDIQ